MLSRWIAFLLSRMSPVSGRCARATAMRDVQCYRKGLCRGDVDLDMALPGHRAKSMTLFTSSYVEAASTLAVIASSNEPVLFLAGDLSIIAASASFCRTFQIDPAGLPGRQLSELGAGEWGMPQLTSKPFGCLRLAEISS